MKWIISNHKKGISEENLATYQEQLSKIKHPNIHLIICPNDRQLTSFQSGTYQLGSQNYRDEKKELLKQLSISYCIVGHSDDRKKYQETNTDIKEKIIQLVNQEICPILCIGEEYKNEKQVKEILYQELIECIPHTKLNKFMIAYEPIWAIHSGDIPNRQDLIERIQWIKKICNNYFHIDPPIVYGGSVNEKTISVLETIENIDGYLIGSASLDIMKLKKIIEVVK